MVVIITLYSTGCPQCKALEKALVDAKIEFFYCDNVEEIVKLGVRYVPILKVDDELMNYAQALHFVNTKRQEATNE